MDLFKFFSYILLMSIQRLYPGDIFLRMEDGIERVAVLGGSGLLAKELHKVDSDIKLFTKEEVDITKPKTFNKLDLYDTIIHTAALIDNTKVLGNEEDFVTTNIIGTANIVNYCLYMGKRLIYISTDYVYEGYGNHTENDSVHPYNLYAWSKLGGECSVRFVPNHVIIRTSFGTTEFPYESGFDNLFTSKDYVDVIAPLIMDVVNDHKFRGVINVGTDRKSIYEYAIKRNPDVKKSSLGESIDFSLNTTKLQRLNEKKKQGGTDSQTPPITEKNKEKS